MNSAPWLLWIKLEKGISSNCLVFNVHCTWPLTMSRHVFVSGVDFLILWFILLKACLASDEIPPRPTGGSEAGDMLLEDLLKKITILDVNQYKCWFKSLKCKWILKWTKWLNESQPVRIQTKPNQSEFKEQRFWKYNFLFLSPDLGLIERVWDNLLRRGEVRK